MQLKKSLFALSVLGLVTGIVIASSGNSIITDAFADEGKVKPVVVMSAFARASLGNLKNSAAFMSVINNTDKADKIIGVTSDIAKRVELHTHIKEGDVMKMRKIDAIDVAAKGFVDLEPGGHHVMLIGLHKPLKAGDKFPITLKFEKNGTVTVDVVVKALGSKSHEDHHRGSHSGGDAKKMEKNPVMNHDRGSH